jgi:hypothetical protein
VGVGNSLDNLEFGRHSLDSMVSCRDGSGQICELGVMADRRQVVLVLPEDAGTLHFTLDSYDRLKHLLILAGNEASWHESA